MTVDHSSSEGDTEGSDRPIEKVKQKRLSKSKKVYKRSLRLTSEQIVSIMTRFKFEKCFSDIPRLRK